jgi:hypothetical protein
VFNTTDAIVMRTAGASLRTIADRLGIGLGTAHRFFAGWQRV